MVHEDDCAGVRALLAQIPADLRRTPVEHRILHKDGSIRWVRNTIAHHYDDNGTLMHYDGLVEDITERKLAEETVRESERLKAMGTLASGVAHSFNTVLSAVSGMASSIGDNVLPGTTAHADSLRIISAVNHAFDLTRHLMGMADACESGGEVGTEIVSLSRVVRETIELLEHPLAERNIRILVRSPETMPFVKANSGQLLDALMSLIGNAQEAMPDGGTITVQAREKTIGKPTRWNPRAQSGRFAVLYVADTGIGIDRKIVGRVFDPFFSHGKGPTSFGLGLTVARNIVESWGGWIDVRSREGVGSTFRVFMPYMEPSSPSEKEKTVSMAGMTVLVIDDDREALRMLREELEQLGLRVRTAEGGEEGIRAYRKMSGEVDLLVVDMVMPGLDGKQVVEHVFKDNPRARVIVLSGFSRDYARHYMNLGAWGFVQKPVEPDALATAVVRAFGGNERRHPSA